MAGLVDKRQSATWLQIVDGSICQKTNHEVEGWEEKKTVNPKTGKEVISWIKKYEAIEDAYITGIRWYETPVEDTTLLGWNVTFNADGQTLVLKLPLNQNPTKRFMKLADNIDFSQPVTVKAWKSHNKEKNRDEVAFNVLQNGNTIPQKWNRENLPEAKQNAITKKWNFEDQDTFLVENMNNNIIPRLAAERVVIEDNRGEAEIQVGSDDLDDTIPF